MSRVVELAPKCCLRRNGAKRWNMREKKSYLLHVDVKNMFIIYVTSFGVHPSRLNFFNMTENVFLSVKISRESINRCLPCQQCAYNAGK